MNTTERIPFIPGHSATPKFSALSFHSYAFKSVAAITLHFKNCAFGILICFGEQHLNDRTELWWAAMFYRVETWKYKSLKEYSHDIISSSCWKSWGKPKPLRGKRNLSTGKHSTKQSISPHFNQYWSIRHIDPTNQSRHIDPTNFFMSSFWHPASGFS